MAEETVQDAATKLAAQYDYGDRPNERQFEAELSTPPTEATAPDARPRNPDGTFASPTPPRVDQPHAPSIPNYLRAAAERVGLAESDIAGLSADEVKDAIAVHGSLANPTARIEQPRPSAPQQAEAPQFEDLPSIPADFDPEIINAFEALKREVIGLRDVVQKLVHREQGRIVSDQTSKLDRAISSLPAEYKTFVGDGSRDDVYEADRNAFQRRTAVVSLAMQMAKDAHDGKPSEAQFLRKIPEAAKVLFGGMAQPAPQPKPSNGHKQLADDLADRRNEWFNMGGAAAPTSRATPELPKGDDRALRTLARGLADLPGFNPNERPTNPVP